MNKVAIEDRKAAAAAILAGTMRNKDACIKYGVSSASVTGWCYGYTKHKIKITRGKKCSFFGKAPPQNDNGNHTPAPAFSSAEKVFKKFNKATLSIKAGKEWSITMGEWRLTLAGINEPEAILLEKI